MSDEEDTTILLRNVNKMNNNSNNNNNNSNNGNFKEMTIIIPIIEKHSMMLSPKKSKQRLLSTLSSYTSPYSCGDGEDEDADTDNHDGTDCCIDNDHYDNKTIQITSLVIFLAGFIYGYDMPLILSYLSELANTFQLTCIQQSLLMVTWAVGGLMALIIGTITSLHCRYTIMLYSMIIILIGTLIQIFTPGVKSMWMLLYGGRALIGFGCVLSSAAHPCYICELLTTSSRAGIQSSCASSSCNHLNKERGYRITYHQLGVTVGVFISLCSTYFFKSNMDYGWRTATALNIIPILLHLLLITIFVPKLNNNNNNAVNSDNENDTNEEINNNNKRIGNNNNNNNKMFYITFLTLFLITFGIHLSGRQSILSLAPTIFTNIGIDPKHSQQSVNITISIVRVICCLISLNIIDKLGRKSLLLMSQLIMFISLLILLIIINNNNNTSINIFNLIKLNLIKYNDEYCPYFKIIDSSGLLLFGAREQQQHIIGDNMKMINTIDDNNQSPPFLYPMLPTPLSLISDDNSDNIINNDNTTLLNVISVIIILVYEAAHALGPSTCITVMIIELIQQDNKCCTSVMYITSIYWIFDYGFSTYLSIFTNYFSDQILNIDFYECSLIFCLITMILQYLLLIETKLKTLQQIQQQLLFNLNYNHNNSYLFNLLFNYKNNNNKLNHNHNHNNYHDNNLLSNEQDDLEQQQQQQHNNNNNNSRTETSINITTKQQQQQQETVI